MNKQLSIDSFLEWEGHQRVFTHSLNPIPSPSPDHSIVLAHIKHLFFKLYSSLYISLLLGDGHILIASIFD